MIIDFISDDPYEPLTIYERTRGADGVLKERYITHEDRGYVPPSVGSSRVRPLGYSNRLRNVLPHPQGRGGHWT